MNAPSHTSMLDDPSLLLHAYLDGELDPVNALGMERKIADDPKLSAERDRILALREVMQQGLPREAISPALRARIENAIGLRSAPSRPSWRVLAASVVLAVLFTGSSTWMLEGSRQPLTAEDAILNGHIRALVAHQPADVPSSDSHTVKPWFNGRVAEAPRVVDLTAAGFPLIGGRLDVVGGQPVPTLVYGRRKHVISLTAVPAPGKADTASALSTDKGYNIIQWVENGVSYWAVSDVSAPDLGELVKLFRARSS